MAVYVDELRYHPVVKGYAARYGHYWCHMTADTLEELHEMANKIGHKRSWVQSHSIIPHYDLTPSRRKLALSFGAIFKPAREQARERMQARAKG